MGKFNVKDDKDRFKAMARSKKGKETGKGVGTSSKQKDPENEQVKKQKTSKKLRTDTDPAEVEPSKKRPSSGFVVVGLPAGEAATTAQEVEPIGEATPEPLRIKEFLSEILKAFLKSAFNESTSSDSNRAKFQLSFNRVISVIY